MIESDKYNNSADQGDDYDRIQYLQNDIDKIEVYLNLILNKDQHRIHDEAYERYYIIDLGHQARKYVSPLNKTLILNEIEKLNRLLSKEES